MPTGYIILYKCTVQKVSILDKNPLPMTPNQKPIFATVGSNKDKNR